MIFHAAVKFLDMYIWHLLILVFFPIKFSRAIADTTGSENALNLFSTDAGSDVQILDNNELNLPASNQPLDTFNGKSNLISDSDPTDPADPIDDKTVAGAGATTTGLDVDLDPEIVAGKSCPSSDNQPSTKLRARNDACATPRQFTGEMGGSEGQSERQEPTPELTPLELMRKFNRRPLSPGQDMHDLCKRFMGGHFQKAVCSSGAPIDETVSGADLPHIPRRELLNLVNCHQSMFIDLKPPPPTPEKKLFEFDKA